MEPFDVCSLPGPARSVRIGEMAQLHDRVRSHAVGGTQAEVVLDRSALAEVRRLVAEESRCCSSLRFDIRWDDAAVRLEIRAPRGAESFLGRFVAAMVEPGPATPGH